MADRPPSADHVASPTATTPSGRGGLITSLRVERPDGACTETTWYGDGQIDLSRRDASGDLVSATEVRLTSSGVVTVADAVGDAGPVLRSPSAARQATNPYGVTVEHLEYAGVITVERTFDDDGSLRSVVVRGEWGEQELELRPDGSRRLSWGSPQHEGRATWGAGEHLEQYHVTFSDRTSYRWDLIDGQGRAKLVDWDGKQSAVDAGPPVGAIGASQEKVIPS